MLIRKLGYGASAAVLAMAASSAVFAQETTGGIRGLVTSDAGAPVSGATVTVTHVPSGTSSTTVTNAEGQYSVRNLRVGGPYTVAINAPGYETDTVEVEGIGIGAPFAADVTLWSTAQTEEVVVTGTRRQRLTSPIVRLNAEDAETLPSIGRDIKDLVRTSPFVAIDPTNNDALLIGGQSNRSNAIYVDGVRQGDDFGLNANGYPTQNSPFSLSLVQAVSVDPAPFNVQYSQFQGGVVNVVTKSGGNDFHGEVFYEKFDDSLRGDAFVDRTGVTRRVTSEFETNTWGATLSGPIIKDRLFFLFNYENFESTEPVLSGPTGSGAANQVPGITQADVDNVRNILKTVYNYDPLDWRSNELATTDEKYFGKIDWNINDQHRFVASYQQTQGGSINATGTTTTGASPSLGLLSKWYSLDSELKVYKAQLFSDWTPNFSTEISVSRKESSNVSTPLGGDEFAEFRVYLAGGSGPSIFLGPDISRQANVLTNDVNQLRLAGTYTAGNHRITAGYEREDLDIYNLFLQRANGQYTFASIADLQARRASDVQYANSANNVSSEGAAKFKYALNTLYIQDEMELFPNLTVTAGLRYDWYQADDKPKNNPAFQSQYGYANNLNLDGISVLQPRVSFNWRAAEGLSVYGGVGLFQGGTPNVWVSNSFTNPGNLTGFVTCRRTANSSTPACPAGALDNVDGFNVASSIQALNTTSANAGTGNINAIEPGFETASIWKTVIGAEKRFDLGRFGNNWSVRGEYLNSQVRRGLNWIDLLQQNSLVGTAPDGRPIYGPRPGGSAQTVVALVNTTEGEAEQVALALSKDWSEGVWDGLSFDLSYTWQDSKDINPGTSSVATSNYGQIATAFPNNPDLSDSNYEIEEAWKLSLGYQREFFDDYRTSVRLFGSRRSGLNYSYTFDYTGSSATGSGAPFGENGVYGQRDRQLFYVPRADSSGNVTLTSDPRVTYASGFNINAFNTFLQQSGLIEYNGQISPRNAFKSPDVTQFDLRLAQELPAFFPNGAKAEVYMDVRNIGNLLNDEWGVVEQVGFPYFQTVTAPTINSAGQYVYSGTSFSTNVRSFNTQSLWQIKVGFRYKF